MMRDYDRAEGVRWSCLSAMATSPLEYQAQTIRCMTGESTPFMVRGSAVHCAVLQPDLFPLQYAVAPEGIDKRTKVGKEAWQAFETANLGKTILTKSEYWEAISIRDAIRRHHPTASLLEACEHREDAIYWTDEQTGLKCKARIDAWGLYLFDLKTTARGIDPRRFASSMAQRLYHGQLAWYSWGLSQQPEHLARGWSPGKWFLGAAQSVTPYDVALYELSEDAMIAGAELCRSLLDRLAECIASDKWPGQVPDCTVLDLPAWASDDEPIPVEEAA